MSFYVNKENNIESNYYLEMAKGNISGHSLYNKFGRNSDIDTTTIPESIWNAGGLYTGFDATTAEIVNVVSTSANDDIGNTGAGLITIEGLDSNYEVITEDIIMNGTTPVVSTLSYLRLDRIEVVTAGSNGANIGTINVTQSISGNKFAGLPVGRNQTHIACFTVPADKTCYIMSIVATINDSNNTTVALDLLVREFGSVFRSKMPFGVAQSGGAVIFNGYPLTIISEKSDVDLRCFSTSSNNADVTVRVDYILVDN